MVNLPISPLGGGSSQPLSAANNGSSVDESGKNARAHEVHKTAAGSDFARESERRSREPENGGWLAQNVHALLAITIMFITFGMFVFVIRASMDATFKESDAKDIVIYILGALTTVATQVVSYYFGSSSGSADKSKALSTIAKRG